MNENAQLCTETDGNTKSVSSRHRHYVGTLNNYEIDEYKAIYTFCAQKAKKYIIGKEVGSSGTPHLQMFVSFSNPIGFGTMKKINERIHWEVCKGNEVDNYNYCSKDGNYITNMKMPYIEDVIEIENEILKIEEMNEWQLNILNKLKDKPDKRTINWVYDEFGGKGKTEFCKYLMFNKLANYLTTGKASDIKYIMSTKKYARDIVFDLPRSMENYISYQVLEELKNGVIVNTKYEGDSKLITRPHIFVFANFEPDTTKMSLDRWNIVKI